VDGSIRYRLLDTLRSFGRERLDLREERDAVSSRHRDYFFGLIRSVGDAWLTSAHSAAMETVAASNDDLLAAIEWSLEHEPRARTLEAAEGLVYYWFWRADPANAYRYGQRMLVGAESEPSPELAAAHLCVGFGAQLMGNPVVSVGALTTAIGILEECEEWKLLHWAYNGQGQGGVFAAMPEVSAAMGRAILALCASHGERLASAYGLALLGEAEFFGDGDFEEARRFFAEAAPLLRELRDDAGLNMFVLGVLASTAALQLDFDSAELAALEASTLGGPGWSATALIVLGGFVLHPRGKIDRAEMVTKQGIVRVHERSMEVWARTGLLILGRIAANRGRWEDAARLFGGCRTVLPPWAQHRRWWNYEATVRDALGTERYEMIASAAAGEPIDDLVAWVLGADPGVVALSD
jgi:tetratricopeptide (TPR) repeat protein